MEEGKPRASIAKVSLHRREAEVKGTVRIQAEVTYEGADVFAHLLY